MEIESILIKDTTKEEREAIVKNSMDCGGETMLEILKARFQDNKNLHMELS